MRKNLAAMRLVMAVKTVPAKPKATMTTLLGKSITM